MNKAMWAPEQLADAVNDFRERAGLTADRDQAIASAQATLDGLRRAQEEKRKKLEAARGN